MQLSKWLPAPFFKLSGNAGAKRTPMAHKVSSIILICVHWKWTYTILRCTLAAVSQATWREPPDLRGVHTCVILYEEPGSTKGNGKVSLCPTSLPKHTNINSQGLPSSHKSLAHTSFSASNFLPPLNVWSLEQHLACFHLFSDCLLCL